jgi:pimeloyl-ACP methyl ester carboxylesterase
VKATATPKVDRTVRLHDGRRMAYCEWGDLAGTPVVLVLGTPTSRLLCPDEDATVAAAVRLITFDRPGYGRSDPRPAATLLDWVDDFIELANDLDLPPCPVLGWSGGGPYAMALAFAEPNRVTTVGLAASLVPVENNPDIIAMMSAGSRAAAEVLWRNRAAGVAAFEKHRAWFSSEGWEAMFAESWGEADDRVLADPATLKAMKTMTREAARQASTGFVADSTAIYSPWGFSPAEIRQPVRVWGGELDPEVLRAETDYLAETIPHATLVMYPEGHLFPFQHWREMLAALLRQSGTPRGSRDMREH